MNRFVIFGNSNYNTLGVVRCMSDKQVVCFLLLVSESCFNTVLLSRGVKEYKRVDSEARGISFLISRKEAWRNAVILPTSDKAESALDAHFNELAGHYRFPHAGKQGIVGALMGKQLQVKLAAEAGLYVPVTVRYKKGERLPEGIMYPCIVKPQNSTTGKKEILRKCQSKDEVLQTVTASRHIEDFLIQQYIDKEYEVLLIGCRLPDGRTWLPGVFQKERWYLKGGDASYGIITTQTGEVFPYLSEVHAFIERLGYYGPFSLEFGLMDGIPYFYEINLRNDGTSHYFHKAGIFVPYIYYRANTNTLKMDDLNIPETSYTFIDEFGDLTNMKATGLSFRRWFHDLRHASAYKYFCREDIKPFLALAPRRIAAALFRIFKSN